MRIHEILKKPEGKTLELKLNLSSPRGILRTLVAFLNTSGGTIIIGVDDDRTIHGLENPRDDEEKLVSLIMDSISPQVLPELEILAWRDKSLLCVKVYPGERRPYFMSNRGPEKGTYIRVGSSNRMADLVMLEELKRYSIGRSFDEEPVTELSSEAIDFRAASELFQQYRPIRKSDLSGLRITTSHMNREVPTIGGLILFSCRRDDYFPDAWLQCGRFAGGDRVTVLDSMNLKGHLPLLPELAMEFLRKHSMTGYRIEGIRRTNIASLPIIALREAIINALVHADYSRRGSPTRLSLFDDRIEVESPGLLQFGLTLEDLKQGVSVLRNRVIGRTFKELHMIEQWGSGIQRMMGDCRTRGLPEPVLEEFGGHFRVTLHLRSTGDIVLNAIDSRICSSLNNSESGLSTSELSAELGISARAVRSHMKELLERGMVFAIGSGSRDPRRKFILAGYNRNRWVE